MEWVWILLVPLAGLMGVSVGLYAGTSLLRRSVRELQYGLADLEDRLVREVKKRAAAARWEAEGDDTDKLKAELETHAKTGAFLSPADFVKKKWGGRHGTQP